MFYVYDPDGIRFRGPMEALEKERKVEMAESITPLRSGRRATPFPEIPPREPTPGNQAVAAYQQATNRENMVEPLVYINQIMTHPVTTISDDISLLQAWEILGKAAIRQLVVVSERNRVAGMLSDRDILRRINVIAGEVEVELALTVRDVMQREIIATDSMSDIRRVARVMAFHHVDAMPVTRNDGQLIGIVTRGDILRSFAENPRLNLWG